jgi:hypothetical protein
MPDECREDFEFFRRRLWRSLAPVGELESLLTDRVISSAWRLRRVLRVEAEAFGDRPHRCKDQEFGVGYAFVSTSVNGDSFSKLSRYEAAIERGLYRALHELQRLQAVRAGKPVLPPVVLDVAISGDSPEP